MTAGLAGVLEALEPALSDYLPTQRWFAGGQRLVEATTVESVTELPVSDVTGGAARYFLIEASVRFAGDDAERYQVPIGVRRGEDGLEFAAEHPGSDVGRPARAGSGLVWYDATFDPAFGSLLLALLERSAEIDGVRFSRPATTRSAVAIAPEPARLLGREQSNSSLVFGDRLILKLYRRLQQGENPELELTRALAAHGFEAVAEPLGWIERDGATLAVLQPFYAGGQGGWELALARVGSLYTAGSGDFTRESGELGRLTADLHAHLAAALPGEAMDEAAATMLVDRFRGQLREVAAEVPALVELAPEVEATYAGLGDIAPVRVQRVHGDFHLGQVLRTADGRWILLDFEGEPVRSFAERRRPVPALVDVAGMLRSFAYAAAHPLLDDAGRAEELQPLGDVWEQECRAVFLDGYRAAGAQVDEAWLAALELDKAVYEARYEALHRPAWLSIPLRGIRRILDRAAR